MHPRHLDVRDLAPPEPMVRALAVLEHLGADEFLLLHHRREPHPLYALLAAQGFRHHVDPDGAGGFVIRIWRAGAPDPGSGV